MYLILKHADGREIVRWQGQPPTSYVVATICKQFEADDYSINDEDEIFVDGKLVGLLERE